MNSATPRTIEIKSVAKLDARAAHIASLIAEARSSHIGSLISSALEGK